MKVVIALLLSVLSIAKYAEAGGRALPIESENYVTKRFHETNRLLKWDTTNYLVDLSGQYATCEAAKSRSGVFTVNQRSKNGDTIVGVRDAGPTSGNFVTAVDTDVTGIVDQWMRNSGYTFVIGSGTTFGCSVRPGCEGQTVLACLFEGAQVNPPPPPPPPTQYGQAFTPEQYRTVENMLGMTWDRSYYLENVAGLETKCSRVWSRNHDFRDVIDQVRREKGLQVTAYSDVELNEGETEPAMMSIMKKFYKRWGSQDRQLGCALIPDCRGERGMYVVVTCLMEDEKLMWK